MNVNKVNKVYKEKIKNKHNLTKKYNFNKKHNLTEKQRETICKNYPNTYTTFEDKINEIFKKNNIDIVSTSYNLEKQIVKELKKAVSPSNIKPNDDFFSYINERWLKDIDIQSNQKYIVQIDEFRLTQDKVYRELIDIIENFIYNSATKHTRTATIMRNAYHSVKLLNSNNQTRFYASQFENLIKQLTLSHNSTTTNNNNLIKLLALFNNNEIISYASPLVWSINPDDKKPTIYKCYIEGPQVSLLDYDAYFDYDDDDDKTKRYKSNNRSVYREYLNNLFNLVFGPNHDYNIKDIYDCEIELLNASICNTENTTENTTENNNYNLISKNKAKNYYGFDWELFCIELGFERNNIPENFITSNTNYLFCIMKILKENWNTKKWITYWIYIYIRHLCRFNKNGIYNHFLFYGKYLRGQEEIIDPKIWPVFCMGYFFNTFLTNEYITKYKNQQTIDYVTTMAQDLKTVFIRILKRNSWLNPKTKAIAIDKLSAIKLVVGSPYNLRYDPQFNYKKNDIWYNLEKFSKWRIQQAIKLVNQPIIDIPVIDWASTPPKFIGTQAYVVNAMYTPNENTIYIPLGYLQKPFVDLEERGIEYNLAHIGFTIAHELSHSLDHLGSKYDKYGVLNDWWTNEDKLYYKKIQKDIIKHYETFAKNDNIIMDAEPSIGEDLADISGFNICQEYLRDFQLKNQDILPIQSLSFEAFFIYFALQSRQKIGKKAINAQLITNPHPLDKYRCNVPLSRTRIFSALYNVKKGDGMWWNNFNSVWSN